MKKFPLWSWFWLPYSKIVPHRSLISHFPVIGTMIRVGYAYLAYVIATSLLTAGLSLLDERNARARILRDRLSETKNSTTDSTDFAFVRDEMLSRIPALDTMLRRSERISSLQKLLSQGEVNVRAGNFLMVCVLSAVLMGVIMFVAAGHILFGWAGLMIGFFLPYAYASHMRQKRFQKFEEKFPEAIDTLARAVRAGHAFTTALELIGAEVSEPVAGEFRQLFGKRMSEGGKEDRKRRRILVVPPVPV